MYPFRIITILLFAFPAFSQAQTAETRRHDAECQGTIHGTVFGQDGKPWSRINLILEPVGDYDYLLPHVTTNDLGQYRFERVCSGKWGVFVEDERAGYPRSGRFMYWFLYGKWSPQVEMTNDNADAQLNINAPPKPGILVVHLRDKQSKARIPRATIYLKVSRKRWARPSCEDSEVSSCDGDSFFIPPDTGVNLRITSRGFREWTENKRRGKHIRLSPGEVLTLTVELESAHKLTKACIDC